MRLHDPFFSGGCPMVRSMTLFAATVTGEPAVWAPTVVGFSIATVLVLALVRNWETRLILLGLFTAVTAIVLSYGAGEGMQASVSVPGASQRAGVFVGAGLAADFMRIAVLLILAGVAAVLLPRCNPPAPVPREEATHVP
jgi:hypothetical protein